MTYEIIGKNGFQSTPSINAYVEKKLSKIKKYMNDEIQTVRVVMKVYPNYHKIEVTLHAGHIILRSEVKDKDMYAAVDLVSDKIVEQIKKYKAKIERKHIKSEPPTHAPLSLEALEKDVLATQLVKNKKIELKPMDIQEAIDHMERLDHDFFVFLDKESRQAHVVYRREDGDYAVIETSK